jgi:hypothetical protein
MHSTKGIAALAVASLALLAAGCNKGPAEDALRAADQALAAAKADVERYVPGELTSLNDAMAAAKAEMEKGNYTEALKAAQALPGRIEDAVAAAKKKKDELTGEWTAMSGRLPGAVQAVSDRMGALAAAKPLPEGITRDLVVNWQKDLDAVTQAWTEATAAYHGGDIPRAVKMAQDVEARADALARALGTAAAPSAVAAK